MTTHRVEFCVLFRRHHYPLCSCCKTCLSTRHDHCQQENISIVQKYSRMYAMLNTSVENRFDPDCLILGLKLIQSKISVSPARLIKLAPPRAAQRRPIWTRNWNNDIFYPRAAAEQSSKANFDGVQWVAKMKIMFSTSGGWQSWVDILPRNSCDNALLHNSLHHFLFCMSKLAARSMFLAKNTNKMVQEDCKKINHNKKLWFSSSKLCPFTS